MNFIERLQYYMTQNGISDNKITVDAGLSIGLIGKAKKSGKAMNSANIEKILFAYPELNPEWLLTGRGEMMKTKCPSNLLSTNNSDKNISKDNENKQNTQELFTETRPRVPFDAAAGSLSFSPGPVSNLDCEQLPLIPTFPRYDFTIIARGDSMFPDFQSGDELACAFVHESQFIQWGRVHVLDTAQGVVVKRIFNTPNSILCKSINKEYPDFEIPKDEVFHIALVIGLIRHF